MDGTGHRITPIPRATWLLLAGAGLMLTLHVVQDWYQLFGPYLIIRPEVVSRAVAATAPFLLGAAISVGLVRWPAGRRWLIAATAAFGLLGLVGLGSEIAMARFMEDSSQASQAALIAFGLAGSWGSAAAPLLVALGLHAARIGAAGPRWMIALVAMLAAAGVAGATVLVWSGLAPGPQSIAWFILSHGLAQAVAIVATAFVAVAALRAAPPRGALPEWLVAIGATSTLAVLGWGAWFQILPGIVGPDELVRFQSLWSSLPLAFTIVGLLTMAGGFALGRLFGRPRASEG
ncbi:MAG TPA: hypothetical protein VM253_04560 [Candidatus Limnocylindrales bacterium]|nr:hypothetical protein [Candidatus Limnocylindrales bacterium]